MLAATAAFGLLLALYSVALPLNEAPDEPAHADLVFHLATGASYPTFDGRRMEYGVNRMCTLYGAAIRACPGRGEVVSLTGKRKHVADAAPDRRTRPTYDQVRIERPGGPVNQMPQHPPLYYRLMSTVLRVERAVIPGDLSYDREFGLLRLANVALVAPVPLLCWWTVRRLGFGSVLNSVIGSTAALIPFVIPQLLHIGSTINNDNLLTLLTGGLVVLLAGVAQGDLSRRTAIAVGVVTGLALLTKAFAIVLPPVVVAAYVVGWRATRRRQVAGAGVLVAGVLAAAVSGWWYLANVIRGDGLAPSTENSRLTSALRRPGFHPDPWNYAQTFGSQFTERFWGWFGWYTVRLSLAVIIGASVLLVVALAAGLLGGRRVAMASEQVRSADEPQAGASDGDDERPLAVGRLPLTVLLLPSVLLLLFVTTRAWSLYTLTSYTPFIQGRYLFPSIIGIAAIAALGVHRLSGRWAPLVVLAWGVVMQVDALRRILSGYWGPPGGGPRAEVRALIAWSPWPGELLAAGALLAVAAGAWLVFEVVRAEMAVYAAVPGAVRSTLVDVAP